MVSAAPGEKYTLRRKFFKVFGAAFHIYGGEGEVVAYCKQKAFKLREDIRLYTGEDMQEELLAMRAGRILDWNSSYRIELPGGQSIGSLRRKGVMSTLVRDEWTIFDEAGERIGVLREAGGSVLTLARRHVENVSMFFPQRFEVLDAAGATVATFRQHFNPVVYRLGISILRDDERIDELMVLAAACLVGAIEGRQE